jgi:translation initiation factor IF-2
MLAGVLGLNQLPSAGDSFLVAPSEKEARSLAEQAEQQQAVHRQVSLEEIFSRIKSGEIQELKLIIKADVQGSVEALRDGLSRMNTDDVQVRVIHAASGAISESDVFLAVASQAIIIGFNTSLEPGARQVADNEKVEIRFYTVIYQLLDDIQNTLEGLVQPIARDTVEGHVVVRAVFSRGRHTKIAGVYVTDGRVLRNALARVLREGAVLFDGQISSLKHFKDDVREMASGYECGVALTGFNDFQEGDILEIHRMEQVSA